MKLSGRKILVTGAGGFIGSHLVERLVVRGADVRALIHYDSRPGYGNLDLLDPAILDSVEVVPGDIRDAHLAGRIVTECDMVFHLAALIGIPYSYSAPGSYVATNVGGTLNVLEASLKNGVERVVHTSTSECYGTALSVPISEDHPLQAQSPYAASKIGADKLAEAYHLTYDLPVSTLRPFNNFGPRQSPRGVVPTIVGQLLGPDTTVKLGSQSPTRDFLYVEDTCEAFCRMAEVDAAVGCTLNVGTGRQISVGDLAKLVMEVVGIDKPIEEDEARIRPAASEVETLICDPSRAREVLGWEPATSLRAGLKEVVEFIRGQPENDRSAHYAV